MKRLAIGLVLLGCLFSLFSQETISLTEILDQAREAIRAEYFQKALDLLEQGEKAFPDSPEIPLLRGDLYDDQELYNLALKEYERADVLLPGDYDILFRKATVMGRLNLNREAVEVLERLVADYPDEIEAVGDLGWMYFKTFRVQQGEVVLREALERFGEDPGLLMTMGTIYTGLYRYDDAAEYYQRSIDAALETGWTYFAAVAYYNLSLLNQSYYHFDEAVENTRRSLEMASRPSGHISLGELALARMDFRSAEDAFFQAYQQDDTPLSLMSLAELYWRFGMLEAAESHLDQVKGWKDDSWMYYFGIDPRRHKRDFHDLTGRIFLSRAAEEGRRPRTGWDRVTGLFRALGYRLRSWYHLRLYRQLSWEIGADFGKEENRFDADISSFMALEDYPALAVRSLVRARDFELTVAPESAPGYFLEEGRLREDKDLLLRALEELDPRWEALEREEALVALVKTGKDRDSFIQQSREALYRINPGAFIREGLVFSLAAEGSFTGPQRRLLRRNGVTLLPADPEPRYRLSLEGVPGSYRLSLKDNRDGSVFWTEPLLIPEAGESRRDDAAFCGEVLRLLFLPR
jgi:tetratricopeptide (TPR) repeat protein